MGRLRGQLDWPPARPSACLTARLTLIGAVIAELEAAILPLRAFVSAGRGYQVRRGPPTAHPSRKTRSIRPERVSFIMPTACWLIYSPFPDIREAIVELSKILRCGACERSGGRDEQTSFEARSTHEPGPFRVE